MRSPVLLLPAVLSLLAGGCGRSAKPPEPGLRVVSLVPSVTEIVYAVGAEASLVGNTTYCDYPEPARHVYKVGDFMNPDIEKIAALRPDIVFLSLPVHRLIAEKLAEMNVRYYVSQPATIEGVFSELDSVGCLLGAGDRADSLVRDMRAKLDNLPGYPDTPSVYAEISVVPLMAAGAGSFVSSLIARAGGRNVYTDPAQEYPMVDPEHVVRAAPEVILILHPEADAKEVSERLGWAQIPAVRDSRVYDHLDLNVLSRPGPRVVKAVYMLGDMFHSKPAAGD